MPDYFELKSINDLQPHPENPRTMTKEAKAGLRSSIENFGDLSGITWNLRNGKLVCGHQRVNELKALGAKCVSDEGFSWLELPAGERFKIRDVDWDEETHLAAMVAANNEAIQGDWTNDVAALVERAGTAGIDTSALRLDLLADRFTPPTDPYEEWVGMPEYVNEDKMPHRSIIVHFANGESVEQFLKLVGQTISEKTKFIWYPQAEIERTADKVYDDKS